MDNISDDPTEEVLRRGIRRARGLDQYARYYIVRTPINDNGPDGRPNKPRRMARNLSLAEAQAWCHSSEASSRTCKTATAKAQTKRTGPWFDGLEQEKT